MTISPLRTAVIGCGRMGLRHIECVRRMNLPIVGISDRSGAALAEASRRYDIPESALFENPANLLASSKPELVVIATTCTSHHDLVLLSVKHAPRFIFCEKPFACSIRECSEMISACENASIRLGVNHQMRNVQHYIRPKTLLATPEFGGFTSMTIVAGNLGVAMNVSHHLDAFRFVAGEFPTRVQAWLTPAGVVNPRGAKFVDHAGCLRFESASGKRLYIDVSADQGFGTQITYGARYGQIHVNEITSTLDIQYRTPESRELPTTRAFTPFEQRGENLAPMDAVEMTRGALEALLRNEDYCTGEQAAEIITALVGAHESSERSAAHVAIDKDTLPAMRRFEWA